MTNHSDGFSSGIIPEAAAWTSQQFGPLPRNLSTGSAVNGRNLNPARSAASGSAGARRHYRVRIAGFRRGR